MLDGDKTREAFSRQEWEENLQTPTNGLLQSPAFTSQPHCLCKAPCSFFPAALTCLASCIPFPHPELTSHLSRSSPGAQLLPQAPLPSSAHLKPTLLLQSLRLCLQGQKTSHWSFIVSDVRTAHSSFLWAAHLLSWVKKHETQKRWCALHTQFASDTALGTGDIKIQSLYLKWHFIFSFFSM